MYEWAPAKYYRKVQRTNTFTRSQGAGFKAWLHAHQLRDSSSLPIWESPQ